MRFSPEVDSKSMCFRLLNSCRETIGATKNFDGVVLYMPIKLPDQVMATSSWFALNR